MEYRKLGNYKYIMTTSYKLQTNIKNFRARVSRYIKLSPDGKLIIGKDYAWDGASGPAFDTKNFMRGSLVHDVFYQLIREKKVPMRAREGADKLLVKITREDGMSRFRCFYVYWAVRIGGAISARWSR